MRTFSLKIEPRHLRLCADRLFHERLRSRYRWGTQRFLSSEMVFESKRRIKFALRQTSH